MSCSLDRAVLGDPLEIGKDRIVGIGLVGTVDVTAAGYRDAVAVLRAAFRDHQVIPAVLFVDMRGFGIAASVALPQQAALGQLLARLYVYLTEIDAVAGIADHIGLALLEIQGRINTALFKPDGIRPFSGRIGGCHEEIAAARDVGRHHVESPLMVTDGRGVDATAAVGVLEVQLRVSGEAVADLIPVDKVFGMIDRNSGEILESAGNQIIIISDTANARVGIEPWDDGVNITKLLRLGSRSNGGHRQQDGDERFVHSKYYSDFLHSLERHFQTPAAKAPPARGPRMKIQSCFSASPPWKRAGPMERAGLTEVPV